MKKVLLTSDAFVNPKIKKRFLEMLDKSPNEVKVLFIPTAAQGEEGSIFWVKESEKELVEMGIPQDNITWLDINNISKAGELNNYDVVYICGGNIFYLLYHLKKTGLDKKIIDFVNSGKVYVGVSAGSVIAGPDISVAGPFDGNKVGLKDVSGLHLTAKVIVPHYQRKEKDIIDEFEKKLNYEIIRLSDGQAMESSDNGGNIIE